MDTAHPVTIIQKMYKRMALLLIPTVRGAYYILVRDPSSFKAWLSGVWIDVILLAFLIILSVCNWRAVKYKAGPDSILLKKGVFYKSEKLIRRQSITSITCHRPALYRLLKAESIYIDTEGGYKNQADMNVTIKSKDREKFFSMPRFGKTYRPRLFEILFLSLCVTDTVASTIYTILLINRAGKIIGRNILTEFIGIIAKAAGYLALAVLVIQLLGILRNFLYYSEFAVHRSGDSLYFENGFFSRTKSICRVSAVNYIDRRQNLISSVFGLDMAFIQCTGYGKARKKEALLIPAGTERSVDGCVKLLLPELHRAPPGAGVEIHSLKPSPKSFVRYIRTPLLLCAALILVGILATQKIIIPYFPAWEELAKFTVFMLVVPLALFAVVRVIAFRKAGVFYEGGNEKMLTLCYYKGLNIHTVSFYASKISHMKIKRSIFQYKNNTCDFILYTGGEGGHKHQVTGLPYDEAFFTAIERLR